MVFTQAATSFEGGVDGTVISLSNCGGASGTQPDLVFGANPTFKTAAALNGSMGARCVAGGTGATGYTISSTKTSGKGYFRVSATPTSDTYVARVETAGGTRLFSLHINAAGKLRVDDAAGTTGVFTFANVLSGAQIYWYQYFILSGSTTGNGTIKVQYGLKGTQTPAETQYLSTTANVGAGQTLGKQYFGQTGSGSNADLDWDDTQIDTTLSDLIGWPANQPPTVSLTANQNLAPSANVSVTATASGNGGATITTYAWSVLYSSVAAPSLSGASTATCTFTASASTAGELYILQCIVTDSNGLTTTKTTEVRIPTDNDATFLPGAAAAAVGTWANVGGAATFGDAVSDNNDGTYVESPPTSATEVSLTQRLRPKKVAGSYRIAAKVSQGGTGTVVAKARLIEGVTSPVQRGPDFTVPVTASPTVQNLDVATPGAIVDPGALFVQWAATS